MRILLTWLMLFGSGSALAAIQPQPRIVGGTIVEDAAWPSVVAIRMEVQNARGLRLERRCVGTLVASRWVLTAAHCFFADDEIPPRQDAVAESTLVYADRKAISATLLDPELGLPVSGIFIHPDYSAGSGSYDADLALVELAYPLQGVEVQPLGGEAEAGEMANIVGWGVTEVGLDGQPSHAARLADELHAAELPIVDLDECRAAMGSGNVSDAMICAGFRDGGVDACSGDSGGPLLVERDGVYRQVGIVSFGDGCAKPDRYGVYTRVSAFADWIAGLTEAGVASAPVRPGPSRAVSPDVPVQPRHGGGAMLWLVLAWPLLRRSGRGRCLT